MPELITYLPLHNNDSRGYPATKHDPYYSYNELAIS